MRIKCQLVMDRSAIAQNTLGFRKEEIEEKSPIIFVDFDLDLNQVEAYRPTVDDNDEEEPYTFIYTKGSHSYCINMPFEQFSYVMKKNKLLRLFNL